MTVLSLLYIPVSSALIPCTLSAIALGTDPKYQLHPELTDCEQCRAVNISFPARQLEKFLYNSEGFLDIAVTYNKHPFVFYTIKSHHYCNGSYYSDQNYHATDADVSYQIGCSESGDMILEIAVQKHPGHFSCQNYPYDDVNIYAPSLGLLGPVDNEIYQTYFGSDVSGVRCKKTADSYRIEWQNTDCDDGNDVFFVTLENHRGESVRKTVSATLHSTTFTPAPGFGEAAWVHVYPEVNPEGAIGESVPCMNISTTEPATGSGVAPEHYPGYMAIVHGGEVQSLTDTQTHNVTQARSGYRIRFHATPTDKLFIAMNPLQINDQFIAFAGGLALYDEQGQALYHRTTGITDQLRLWDLGVLKNRKPGLIINPYVGNPHTDDPRHQVRLAANEFGNLPVTNARVDQLVEAFLHTEDDGSHRFLHTLVVNVFNTSIQPNPLCEPVAITFSDMVVVLTNATHPLFTPGQADYKQGLSDFVSSGYTWKLQKYFDPPAMETTTGTTTATDLFSPGAARDQGDAQDDAQDSLNLVVASSCLGVVASSVFVYLAYRHIWPQLRRCHAPGHGVDGNAEGIELIDMRNM